MICLGIAALIFNARANSLSELEYLTESYPPYNYQEEGELKGISVDLLRAALARAGEGLPRDNIQLLPWPRAYKMALAGPERVLFSTTRTQLREDSFHWVGPIIETQVVLLARSGSEINIQSIDELSNYSIGAIKDDIGEQLLLSFGVPAKRIKRAHSANSLLKMLNKGRIQLWAYEENVASWNIHNSGLDPSLFESVFTLQESELYYAFSKDTDPELIKKLQLSIDEIKSEFIGDGHNLYEQIISKYR
ncbi:transporter substrate-binding domain-containing protein [Shewanella canadensis]|uniref:Transporter substrate-binding domain-containing protein n=2 Tax=Shewanella canadensis TaxID=271096 RepID=A0A431WY44_9GAMM|nr:transporter substrate-binding domain-containing protein [Shewanella canadensis]